MRVPLFRPQLGTEELRNLRAVFQHAWVGMGPKTQKLEERFAKYVDARFAVGVTSCTAALHIALQALGVKKGDEVIVPAITVVSTPYAALYNGATPVFADVEEETLCIDPNDLARKITKKTKAIIPVHLGGHVCDMDKIMRIARRYKLFVVEDCANALGARYKGKRVGNFGDINCFSFEAKKNMTTGDGGMLTTNDKQYAEKLKALRWYGSASDTWKRFVGDRKYSWKYDVSELGWKYNMTDIIAAIGLAQLAKLPGFLAHKDKLRGIYNKKLGGLPWLRTPQDRPYTKSGWWLYIVRIDGGRRDSFMEHMARYGVTTSAHFPPVYRHSYFKKIGLHAHCPVAERAAREIVSLPLFPGMSAREQRYVIGTIKRFPA